MIVDEQRILRGGAAVGIVASFLFLAGCHGSDEAEKDSTVPAPSATALMQKQVNDLRAENASLKQQIEKLQQENRSATAHSAELETQLADMKDRQSAPPPKPATDINQSIADNNPPPKAPGIGEANAIYEEGLSLYRRKNYRDAIGKFEAVTADAGPGGMADRGTYWLGECHYALKNYKSAIEAFKKVLEFDQSTKKDDAQMMLANSYLADGSKSKAEAEYKKLISNFPASPYVAKAKAKLKHM